MQRSFTHVSASAWLILASTFLCLSLVACGSIRNPDSCTVMPPTGYPTMTLVNGILYMESSSSLSLYALRPTDGSLLWQYPAASLLAVENGLVYVTDKNDVFSALQANNGAVRWKYDMGNDVSSIVAVVDGLVYFTSSNTLTLYTLRASDGTRLWQHTIDVDHFPSTILAANGIAYVAAEYERITALRESDGSQLWQDDASSAPPSTPLSMSLGNGLVYASADQTTALRASDGAVLWHFAGRGPSVVGHDVVYVSASNQSQLVALRASDGSQLWHWPLPSSEPYTLTLAQGMIYAGPGGGTLGLALDRTHVDTYKDDLYALKSEDGSLLWHQPLETSRSLLGVSGLTVYTLAPDALDAWQTSNGTHLWHHPLQHIGLLLTTDTVYAGTAGVINDCFPLKQTKLAALQATTGNQLWQFQAGAVKS
jgi:outer membrane protein assembly factor BamB